jgi:hypothetical protein
MVDTRHASIPCFAMSPEILFRAPLHRSSFVGISRPPVESCRCRSGSSVRVGDHVQRHTSIMKPMMSSGYIGPIGPLTPFRSDFFSSSTIDR